MLKKLHAKPEWSLLTEEKKAREEKKAIDDLLAKRDAQKRQNEIVYNVMWEHGELDDAEDQKADMAEDQMDWKAEEEGAEDLMDWKAEEEGAEDLMDWKAEEDTQPKRKMNLRRKININETIPFSPEPAAVSGRKRRMTQEHSVAGKKKVKYEERAVLDEDESGWVTEPEELVADLWSAKDKLCKTFLGQIEELEPMAQAANDEFMRALFRD
jgi:hypothetical protein